MGQASSSSLLLWSVTFLLLSDNIDANYHYNNGNITTIAGSPTYADGIGTYSRFYKPWGVEFSPDGSYALICEQWNLLIRKIEISNLAVTTIAGDLRKSGSMNGIGTNARFTSPYRSSISPDGKYALVVDNESNQIRKIIISSLSVTLFAGNSISGSADGVGTNSTFRGPQSVRISPDGSFALVVDTLNQLIRYITISTASVSTLAGSSTGSSNGVGTNAQFKYPDDATLSLDGSYALIVDTENHLIRYLVVTTATVTTLAGGLSSGDVNGVGTNARFNYPSGIDLSPDGNYVLICDDKGSQIRKLDLSTTSVTLFAGAGTYGTADGVGTNAYFNILAGISISPDGTVALTGDSSNHLIRNITLSNALVSLTAGTAVPWGDVDGTGTNSKFNGPVASVFSSDNLYTLILDSYNNQIRKMIISTAAVSIFAGGSTSGTTDGIGTHALFYQPYGISLSPNNEFAIVSDTENNVIRYVTISTASVSTLAGSNGPGVVNGVGTNAKFNYPHGVGLIPDGSIVFVADYLNHVIRKIIISTAEVTVYAGQTSTPGSIDGVGTNSKFNTPRALCISTDGSFALVTDSNGVRKINLDSVVVTTATRWVGSAAGIAVSPDGMYSLIADANGHVVSELILPNESLSAIAGTQSPGSMDGIGTNAEFYRPSGVTFSPDGKYALIADFNNHLIRVITALPSSPTVAPSSSLPTIMPTMSPSPIIPITSAPSPAPTLDPPINTKSDESDNKDDLIFALVGGIVGGVCGLVCIVILIFFIMKRKTNQLLKKETEFEV